MVQRLDLNIVPQPTETTCGPTCLYAAYRYFGDAIALEQVIAETQQLDEGGTLDVFLACHALKRGYRATIYPYNLNVFDPTWFEFDSVSMLERLEQQLRYKRSRRLGILIRGYIDFLRLGGRLRFEDLTPDLIRRPLKQGLPVLTGLNSTYLYRTMREVPETCRDDDLRGEPTGHFVVLCGYDRETRRVEVADPYQANPISGSHEYAVSLHRLIGAIYLGIVTMDANLLIIEPGKDTETH